MLNNIKVMILAAGEGTRLRPLTYFVPKPLNPILNKPVMEYTIDRLVSYGVREVMVNVSYGADKIMNYFGNGEKFGLTINYSFEKEALGTAGGVKKVENFFDGTFLIVSGDGLSEIDLEKAVRFHKQKGSLGTIVLSTVDLKYEYGIVRTTKSGRIRKFLEKPTWNSMFPSSINTGVYVFEPEIFKYIPKNKFYDFGCQVWPALLKKRKPIFAVQSSQYWCDIGDLKVYLNAHWHALDKKINLKVAGKQIKKNVWIGNDCSIESTVEIRPPCVIGSGCTIGNGAKIGPYVSMGNNVTIAENSLVKRSVFWNNIKVDKNIFIEDTIITGGVSISGNQNFYKNAVITNKVS